MVTGHVPRRVADAILSLAGEHQDYDAWLQDLQTMSTVLGQEQSLHVLDHPDIPVEEKVVLVDGLIGSSVRPESRNIVYYLLRKRRVHLLPAILRELQGLVNQQRNVRVADVTTAQPLTKEQQDALGQNLADRFGGTITFEEHVDPAIIGGIVVRVGDILLDGSVNGRLRALREQIVRAVR